MPEYSMAVTNKQHIALLQTLAAIVLKNPQPGQEDWIHSFCFDAAGVRATTNEPVTKPPIQPFVGPFGEGIDA